MTRDVVRRGAQFVIWPESSTPFTFEERSRRASRRCATWRARSACRFCSAAIRSVAAVADAAHYNAAFQLDARRADGRGLPEDAPRAVRRVRSAGRLADVLSAARADAGRVRAVLAGRLDGHAAGRRRIGEHGDLLRGGLSRRSSARRCCGGSELLTTITNDAWYGHSSAPYQHFAMASMRAIEQGRYLARAANTGISGVVDPYGRVVRAVGVSLNRSGLVEEVRFLTGRTIYSRDRRRRWPTWRSR